MSWNAPSSNVTIGENGGIAISVTEKEILKIIKNGIKKNRIIQV